MSDILFWDANSIAGSGAVWNTGIDTPQTVPDHVVTNDGWEVPIRPFSIMGERPYEPTFPTSDRVDYLTSEYSTHGAPPPDLTDAKLKEILSMVNGYESPVYKSKEEIQAIEDEAVNRKVHNLIRKLLKD